MNKAIHFFICGLACTLSLSAGDLLPALGTGSIWGKTRKEICSSDFVGLRYMPIDDYSIRLTPRLTINEGCCKDKNKGLKAKSKLTIGELELGETLVKWDKNEMTANMLAVVYTRGDDGDISRKEFAKLTREAIQVLDNMAESFGHPRENKGKGDEEHVGVVGLSQWYWEWETGVMLLEASATETCCGYRPEFIRLKMGPTPESIATGGLDNLADKKWLKKNVVREQDTYIAGIPMVDQGQKGYCVPASVARVFAYYGVDAIDQHALAQLCDTLTKGGTSVCVMQSELQKIGDKYGYDVKNIRYSDRNWLREAREAMNDGMPVLWCVQMGIVSEPGIPAGGAQNGHMRLIIGYNTKTNEIIYTDSWGAGHEYKRLKIKDAKKMTRGMYVLEPKK